MIQFGLSDVTDYIDNPNISNIDNPNIDIDNPNLRGNGRVH